MPNIKSAKKRVALSKAAYEKNKADKSALKTAVKKFEALCLRQPRAGRQRLQGRRQVR